MLAEFAAAPEVGVLAAAGLALLALLAWAGSRGLMYIWRYSVGKILLGLGQVLRLDVGFIHWHPGDWLIEASDWVEHELGRFAGASEQAVGFWFHATAVAWRWSIRETAALAADLYNLGQYVVRHDYAFYRHAVAAAGRTIVRVERIVTTTVIREAGRAASVGRAEVQALARSIATGIEHTFRADWEWLARRRRALERLLVGAGAIALPLPLLWPGLNLRLRSLEFWRRLHARRLSRLEKLLTASGIAAVMAMALGLPNWRCITRGNLGRLSRGVCGMPSRWLADVLGLLTDFLILENICTLIPWLEEAANVVGVPLVDGLAAVVGAGSCEGTSSPPALTGPALSLPAVQPATLYLPG